MNKIKKAYKMFRYYQEPIENLMSNILEILDRYNAYYTVPITTSVIYRNEDFVKSMYKEKRIELASHGHRHYRYTRIPIEFVALDILKSKLVFDSLSMQVDIFRAPYNDYSEEMLPRIGECYLKDIGYFFKRQNLNMKDCMVCQDGLTLFPVSHVSDDKMLDVEGLSIDKALKKLIRTYEAFVMNGGKIITFDLHPIRIGRKENLSLLEGFCEHVVDNNGFFVTPMMYGETASLSQFFDVFDIETFVILSGDIDQWGFFDYLRR